MTSLPPQRTNEIACHNYRGLSSVSSPLTDSGRCRPLIPVFAKKWTTSSGLSGRHAPESVDAILRIHWPPCAGIRIQSSSMTGGKLRFTPNGDLQAVIERSYYDVFRVLRSGGTWGNALLLDPGHTTSFGWPDNQGGVHLYGAFFYLPNLYSYWRDGIYSPQSMDVPVTLSSRETQLDGQNNLHTYWTGSVPVPGDTVTGVYYQCQDSGLNWQSQWNPSGYGAVLGKARSAWDDDSYFALAWQVEEPHEVQIAFWEGCNYLITDYFTLAPGDFELVDTAYSSVANKACVLLRKQYTSDEYRLLCANIYR